MDLSPQNPPLGEQLVRTPSVEEACTYLEGWARGGRYPAPLLLVGKEGVGKRFLLRWATALADQFVKEGKGKPLLPPPRTLEEGRLGEEATDSFLIFVGEPEYERKMGVLLEWARVRGIELTSRALELILRINTHNLERLRGLTARAVLESGCKGILDETDVLRTLERSGLISQLFS